MKIIEDFVLGTPYLFLKKIPYLWILLVVFWVWPPILSSIIGGIIILGLILMALQQRFWENKVKRDFQKEGQPFRDHPRAPFSYQVRNVSLVLAGSALLGLLLGNRLDLNSLQWFLLSAGLMLLYKDSLIFGSSAVYLITPRGIAVRFVPGHVDYRLFFSYNEINHIVRVRSGDELPRKLDVLSPMRDQKEGILLMAKHPDGFSNQIGHVLLTPTDADSFLGHVPSTLIEKNALIR
ncbi:MAG TPA: hypothetical protein VMT73_03155 [Anaerolineales bacterium]|nr:hypothetical protein [Anaerolineales bacterium]